MTRFFPIYVRRSDGKQEVVTSKGKETNGPSSEQLDRTPNAKGVADYYREIAHDETKHLDWRKKLAGMLVREIGGADFDEKAAYCVLESLPENYRLFEHIKSRATDKDGKPQQAKKNHAGGGHDRQDAYLYGHPAGPKKRFRSPADFFPHLLWLSTDITGDPNNCSCKVCCPEEIEDKSIPPKEAKASPVVKKEELAVKKEEVESKPKAAQQHPIVEVRKLPAATPTYAPISQSGSSQTPMSRTNTPQVSTSQAPSSQISTPQIPASHISPPRIQTATPQIPASQVPTPKISTPQTSTPSTPQASQPQQVGPTPLPQPRSGDQQIDAQFNRFAFRSGEVVWFNRGQSWGLAVIVRRYANRGPQEELRTYILQPLSHPFVHPTSVNTRNEKLLRPWLAWSPPNYTHKWLNDHPTTFEHADWPGLTQQRYGPGDCEVDGSILAARSIDASYTPFDPIKKSTGANGAEERRWNGLFLGGEKIWVGDPVRLKIGTGAHAIMVVIEIVERSDQRGAAFPGTTFLHGDVYTFAKFDLPNQELPNDQHLPLRMREDARWRNQYTFPATGTRHYWKLIQPMARIQLVDIKGRWYESSFLLPLLHPQPQQLPQALQRGEITDPGGWLNSRGDAHPATMNRNAMRRTSDRREAVGRAVPERTKVMDGIAPPAPTPQSPAQQMQPQQPQQQQQPHPQQQQQQPPQRLVQQRQQPDATPMQMDHYADPGQGALDEFMNLDGMDGEGMPGFGQTYGSQETDHGYY